MMVFDKGGGEGNILHRLVWGHHGVYSLEGPVQVKEVSGNPLKGIIVLGEKNSAEDTVLLQRLVRS